MLSFTGWMPARHFGRHDGKRVCRSGRSLAWRTCRNRRSLGSSHTPWSLESTPSTDCLPPVGWRSRASLGRAPASIGPRSEISSPGRRASVSGWPPETGAISIGFSRERLGDDERCLRPRPRAANARPSRRAIRGDRGHCCASARFTDGDARRTSATSARRRAWNGSRRHSRSSGRRSGPSMRRSRSPWTRRPSRPAITSPSGPWRETSTSSALLRVSRASTSLCSTRSDSISMGSPSS